MEAGMGKRKPWDRLTLTEYLARMDGEDAESVREERDALRVEVERLEDPNCPECGEYRICGCDDQ